MRELIFGLSLLAILLACEHVKNKKGFVDVQIQTPSRVYNTWELNHPERATWSDKINQLIGENENVFFAAEDIGDFCPAYHQLTRTLRTQAVSEIIVAISKYESNWKPDCYFKEPTTAFPQRDVVTGLPVASEGLLQLSYGDSKQYKFCQLSYANKDLFDPVKNLDCGTQIFIQLVKRDKRISGQYAKSNYQGGARYWSTLRIQNHRNDIIKYVRLAVKECK